jgi:hypothetical protein
MSCTKVSEPIVVELLNILRTSSLLGIRNKDGMFIGIPSINIDPSGNLFYIDSKNRRNSVRSLIMSLKGLQSARWLDHLYFLDRNTNIVSFKKYLINKTGLHFT